jgi:DNA-binding FadR family transcriptional regulator
LTARLGELGEVAEAHVPVMDALAAGDSERAGRAVREHIEELGRWVAERLATTEPDAS